MRKLSPSSKKLQFERLECRTFLAGDVTAFVSDGVLKITGDSADNSIQIKQAGKAWQVRGIDTTVNSDDTPQKFTGVTDIWVRLEGGYDTVSASKGKLPVGTFFVHGGSDATTVSLSKLTARYIEIQTLTDGDTITLEKCQAQDAKVYSSGDPDTGKTDTVTILGSDFNGNLDVITGDNDDLVTINKVAVGGGCTVITSSFGNDQDNITISKLRTRGSIEIETGDGSDVIKLTDVASKGGHVQIAASHANADNGNDSVAIDTLTASDGLKITTGDGDDFLSIKKCAVSQNIEISMYETAADGNDTVLLTHVKSKEIIVVDTGPGTDEAELTKLDAGVAIGVHMGDGNSDNLSVTNSRAMGALLIGGYGDDDQVTLKQNKWKKKILEIVGFEWPYG